MKDIGIYVHIPFCKKKCNYCDFTSHCNKDELIEEYIKWLTYEIQQVAKGNKLDSKEGLDELVNIKTIYIGGGTPSYIDSKYIKQIMNTITTNFNIGKNPEITIEINPGTVNKQKLNDYKKSGINRISIGLQSTQNEILKLIGRIHTYEEFLKTYNLVKEVGFENINVDLMIGIPNQTLEHTQTSIKEIIKLEPKHISVYSLILEEGTKLEEEVKHNKLKLPEEELERTMYWDVKQDLEEAGYMHYEISNFAKKGYESKHNMDCWSQKEYIGFGVAAHSYTNGVRYSNIEELEEFIDNFKKDKLEDNIIFHEKQTHSSKIKEYMLLNLRKIKGVNIEEFIKKFNGNPKYIFKNELEKLENQGLIEVNENIKLTNKGIDLANIVWEEFV